MLDAAGAMALCRDIAATFAAISGGCVAWLGLGAWKKQLAWRSKSDSARRLLSATLRLRDGIGSLRRPFITLQELADAAPRAHADDSDREDHRSKTEAAYLVRWDTLVETVSDFDVEVNEAEVLWGSEVVEVVRPLRECVSTLQDALVAFLKTIRPETGDDVLQIEVRAHPSIMKSTSASHEFQQSVDHAVDRIASFVQNKLNS